MKLTDSYHIYRGGSLFSKYNFTHYAGIPTTANYCILFTSSGISSKSGMFEVQGVLISLDQCF